MVSTKKKCAGNGVEQKTAGIPSGQLLTSAIVLEYEYLIDVCEATVILLNTFFLCFFFKIRLPEIF